MNSVKEYIRLIRPKQWVKNSFVIAPLLFAHQATNVDKFFAIFLACISFCFVSGSIYIVNDIFDRKSDRLHPVKRSRPLAAKTIKIAHAIIYACVLLVLGFCFAKAVGIISVCAVYVALQLAYTIKIKHVIILDVISVASGFVLRVIAGVVAIGVELSPWLVLCTFLLTMFIATTKRRQEIVLLQDDGNKENRRSVLSLYTIPFLDQMISIETPLAIIAYAIYTLSERTVELFGTTDLVWTVPFVLYGILRYLYLVYQEDELKHSDDPTLLVLKDYHLWVNVLLWVASCAYIIYR